MKKYVLHADHFSGVSIPQLAHLYGVRLTECIVIDHERSETKSGFTKEYLDSLIHLRVRSDGDYTLPTR